MSTLGVGGVFALMVLLTDLYAVIRILRAACSKVTKMRWVTGVVLVPVIGVVVWMLFGPS